MKGRDLARPMAGLDFFPGFSRGCNAALPFFSMRRSGSDGPCFRRQPPRPCAMEKSTRAYLLSDGKKANPSL
ncbi:hypothetical protein KSP40_PGU012511 [Platanthera guangdongensis]|uniref:Uncharacterized protein n=1 Tax=Platanthera guangdongensis TaxID=2320717 RepID=A0ABR2MI84_9ASPA